MPMKRTIYFDDARHYFLWNFEPPIDLLDFHSVIDQVAGTAVDTFIYGVARMDGLFYDTSASLRFGADRESFRGHYEWRAYNSLQSLIDRGLSPLQLLIDRAHQKGMEFIPSLRLGEYGTMPESMNPRHGGRGWVHDEVRAHLMGIVKELVADFPTDGIELDFAAPPAGCAPLLQPEDVSEYTPVLTEWLREASSLARDNNGTVGARVYPTSELNDAAGFDIETWLNEGLVDYVAPLVYAHNILDCDTPIEWLIESAHQADVAVYPILMAYYNNEDRHYHTREMATPEMMRAAFANHWAKGCDGMYTWFMRWPLGERERSTLSEMGDRDLIAHKTKHYFVNRDTPNAQRVGFDRPLPLELPLSSPESVSEVPFYVADDCASDQVSNVVLRILMHSMVSADKLVIKMNGQSLAEETCLRSRPHPMFPYDTLLEFHLRDILPRIGANTLQLSLEARPPKLGSTVVVEDVDIIVNYQA